MKTTFWEMIHKAGGSSNLSPYDATSRSPIPGGWIVKHVSFGGIGKTAHSLTYVPDPDNEWKEVPIKLDWELVHEIRDPNRNEKTFRLRVPGGWIVRSGLFTENREEYGKVRHLSDTMIYIPDRYGAWEK